MEFGILGPLEVVADDRVLDLGGGRRRAVLAALLLHANETVSVDRIIDAVWGASPPRTANKAVQGHVFALRKTLGAGRINTNRAGYTLEVRSGELDADRFRQLLGDARRSRAAGDAAQAGRTLRQALGLWRGRPLADLAYADFAQAEVGHLEELRVAALEERIDADLALGAHADLVGELEVLVREHPLRERLRGQLMLALYRCGRQAEALEAYQAARRTLVDELGIEPRRALQDLERAILRQDPSLDPPAAATEAAAEAGWQATGVFVGRERELAELEGALDDALAGSGRLVLLAGEPGIGKTRLAEELMARARGHRAQVLVGRCWEAGGAPAYWPWVQSLRAYIRETEPATLRAQLGAGGPDLAQLLPELRELFPDLPEPPVIETEGARFRLFDAAAAFIKSIAATRPLVVVLDDLHAADAPSLLLLQFLARELSGSHLLVVGAYRDVDPTVRDPLATTLAEVAREPATHLIPLLGLSEQDVGEYVERTAGLTPAPKLAEAIHGETEGNPLFIGEVVRLLDAEGRLGEADVHLRIPPSVRGVIGQRVRRLSEPCRSLLVLASVLGREFALDALAQLSELPEDELLEALDEALAQRVVGEVPSSPGRLRFGHALIRDTLYDALSMARRVQLHRRAGEALESLYADDLEPHLSELAYHFFETAHAGGAGRTTEYALRAGNRAVGLLAYEEAVRHYEMALTFVADPADRCELLLMLGNAQGRAGDNLASKLAYRRAAELAEELGLSAQLARAALEYGGRLLWDVSRDDEYLVPLLEHALDALGAGDSTLRAKLLARLAGGPLRDARFPRERRASLSREALEMARRLGDPTTLAYALAGYISANHSPDHTARQVELATELVQVALEVGDLERAVEAYDHRGEALHELGEMSRAKTDADAMARLAGELRQPSQKFFAAVFQAQLALVEGRLIEADRLIHEALELGRLAQPWDAVTSHGMQLYILRRFQGRLDELEPFFESERDAVQHRTYPVFDCILARFYDELGREADARIAFERLAKDDFAALPFDEEWLVGMSLLAETARSLGDVRRARLLYGKLLPYADRVAVGYPEIGVGSVARYLGILAATLSEWEDAERHFQQAVEMNERIGARPWLAQTHEDYARLCLERAAPRDRAHAQRLLAAALATYRELGMGSYAANAGALAQEASASR